MERKNAYEKRLLAGIGRISKPDRDWMPNVGAEWKE